MDSSDFKNHETQHSPNGVKKVEFKTLEETAPACYGSEICDQWLLDDLYYEASMYELSDDQEQRGVLLQDKHALLSWLCAQAALSPFGVKMLYEAMHEDWSLALEDLEGPDFHIDVPEKLIVLDSGGMLLSALGRSEYFRNILLVSFIRALRDVWQEKRHGGFDEHYGPADILMLERVRAADLAVMAVMVAWEIRGEGYGGLWRYLIGSEDGDIAMRFSGHLERDPSSLFNGQAMAAAFAQWFRNYDRVNICEHEILNDLDMVIEERSGYGDIFGHEKLTSVKIESLSCLPDKTAYLHHKGRDIMGDPHYAGLSNMVNQAHFMQVVHDMGVIRVQNVPFRDASLAAKIFPNGEFTPEDEGKG